MADLRGPPPPRYRVVERDRKLVVIDTETGETSATPSPEPTPLIAGSWWPRQLQFDGSTELTTHAFYDEKGPRTIRLDAGSAATVERLKLIALGLPIVLIVVALANPWLLLPLFALSDRRLRTRLRGAATRWLDRVEREAS